MALITPQVIGGLTAIEELSDESLSSTAKRVTHNAFSETTTPSPATMYSGDVYALTTGAKTIDLRAIYTVGAAVGDANGLKVQGFFFKNLGANAMTIVGGASNGYLIFGTSGSVVIQPGGWLTLFTNDGSADIDATHKTIDVSGTGSQTFECGFIFG